MNDASTRNRIGPWSPPDQGVPSLEAFERDRNFVVEAAAGSGKTTALVGRMVALVRAGVPVERIAAITFTRKAAGEMNERFFLDLQRVRDRLEPGDLERQRVEAALADLQRAFIGTIHAFCARLLRERPLEAGLPPDFTAGIDDRDERRLRERAWTGYLRDVWRDDRAQFEALETAGLATDDLFDFFGTLCRFSELEPFTDGLQDPPDLSDAVERTHAFLDAWLPERPDPPPQTAPGATLEAFATADRFRTYRTLDDPATQAEFLDLFSGLLKADTRKSTDTEERGDVKKKAWGDCKDAANQLDNEALPDFVTTVIRPALKTWRAFVHRTAVRFTVPAVERFTTLRRQEGQLTFQDLLLAARDLLRDHPAVRTHFQERYRYLLVDEFQDTDPIQAELLFYLTADDPEETDWTACRPRPGSLFIVGDSKQSIYRFRRADMEVFQTVAEQIDGQAAGAAEELTTNFRSVEPLLSWFNDAFEALYGDEALADVQADYRAFEAHRDAGDDPLPVRQLSIDRVYGHYPDPIVEDEADRIARYIAEDVSVDDEGPPAYDDYMILTRLSKRLKAYADALSAQGIPYTITGSKDLGDSDELRALVDLLTCVERPDDPVARVAYLRGLLVGLSDDDLYRYHRAMEAADGPEGFGGDPMPVPAAHLKDPLDDQIQEAADRLERVGRWLRDLSPAAAVARILDEEGFWAVAAHPRGTAGDGSLRAGHLARTLVLVQKHDAQNLHWTDVREELQRILDGDETVDGMTLETGGGGAVRLMNVHQAKGLQAPVVFLADPYDRYHNPTPSEHVRREENDVVAPVERHFGAGRSTQIAAPVAWDETYEVEAKRHHAAEERRLQYVAATRAKDRLIVSRYTPKDDGFWAELYPFLDAHDVPELDVPPASDTDSAVAPAPNPSADAEARKSAVDAASVPSFTREAVTDGSVETGGDGLPAYREATGGYGAAFGEAVHRLLELTVSHRTDSSAAAGFADDAFVEAVLDDAGASTTRRTVERAQRMLEAFRASALWARVQQADAVRTEVPIADLDGVGTSRDAEGTAVIRTGTVDLLLKTDGGWELVDFKTDRCPGESAPETVPAAYAAQLRMYAAAWTASAAPVARAGIYWADAGELGDWRMGGLED